MGTSNARGERERWARLRFAVVGPLLASPPPKGRLRAELERLAQQDWEHPSGEGPVRFSASTIERWYYRAGAWSITGSLIDCSECFGRRRASPS